MRNIHLTLLFFLCNIFLVFAQNSTFDTKDEIEKEVRSLEMRRFEMMVHKDTKGLSEILGEDLVYIHANGVLEKKSQFLETLDKGKTLYQSIQSEEVGIRVIGDAAVINGVATVRVWTAGQTLDMHLRYTDVYVRRNGKWQLISWQSTRIQP
ncbi:nuclear transport factor 2 family protein [Cytophagaceae bacterium YF14B1]|uniref:Nuclear transport factor 2 family protein n=1 Tax=Xanthocytophaga flava TaxID=3048013 RepID=A0AAE3U985_9BACT|nr:nuclear transport factor 2 family protein [Xanthocytophaga flavus]MDJ1481459.1 nuclear transport factor 2 family protein [Xanthocytophaga flavus]